MRGKNTCEDGVDVGGKKKNQRIKEGGYIGWKEMWRGDEWGSGWWWKKNCGEMG